jgi:hypothetical protein
MTLISWKTTIREKEFWLLILLGVAYFYRPLFLGETFFFRDLYSYFLPQKQLLVDLLKAGELPLWDPYLHGGQAYLTNIANGVLYPFNLLYLCLPLLKAFNLIIVLHIIGCAAFAYLFARSIGLQPVSSFIVGLIYGFCGCTLSLINLLNFLLAMPYLPLLCLCWHRYLLAGQRKWFGLTVIVGVFQILPGAPEINVISLLSLLGWTLCYPYPQRSRVRLLCNWFLLGIFMLGIASIQLVPTLEVVAQSSRGQGLDYGYFSPWSLEPKRLPEFVFPHFFGYIDTIQPDVYYWGTTITSDEAPYILSIYLGGVAIALIVLGGLHKEDRQILSYRVRILLLILFICSLVLALGRFLPFFKLLYCYIPFVAIFRYPTKFLIAGLLPGALLAGYASEIFLSKVSPEKRAVSQKTLAVLWGVSALLISWAILFLLSDDVANWFQSWFFKQRGNEIMRSGLLFSFGQATAVWLVLTLLFQSGHFRRGTWQHWLLACLLTIDFLSAGRRLNPTALETFYTTVPPAVQLVRQEIGEGRLFRAPNPPEIRIWAPTNQVMWTYRLNLETLESYPAAFFRIPVIFHRDLLLLAPIHLIQLTDRLYELPWRQRLPVLSAGAVSLILTPDKVTSPGMRLLAEIPHRGNIPFYLYRNEHAAARVTFVTNWEYVASDAAAFTAMRAPTYDPRTQVILQQPATPQNSQLYPARRAMCAPAHIQKLSANTHAAIFTVSNQCNGYVVFAEPFYHGWHVIVDGHPTPIVRANYAFSAIFLPAGDHRIERYYCPTSLLFGAFSSLVFCGGLYLLTFTGWGLKLDCRNPKKLF